MDRRKHDLVVIGAGPGGYVAAIRAAQLGLNVACIDKEDKLGGTCLRIGCISSKALLESSRNYWFTQHESIDHGIVVQGVAVDLGQLMARKQRLVDELTGGIAGLFAKYGVQAYQGSGRLLGNGRVQVSGQEQLELEAQHIIVATGLAPASLKGVETDGKYIGDSTTGLSFTEVPPRLVIIGAGYIGLELGSVWSRLGSKVTVLEYLDRILPGIDSELAYKAQGILKKQNLEFRLSAKVTSAKVVGDDQQQHVVVEVAGAAALECDRVLVVVGRRPYTEALGLEEAGVAMKSNGCILVDDNYSTSAAGVYAIGDVIEGPMLAHKASSEALACVEKIVTGYGAVNYSAIPAVVFTDPEIASVGLTEDALQEAGTDYKKGMFLLRANGRAKTLGMPEGWVKVLSAKATDRILGVHILSARAGDLIAECTLALELGATSEDIARTCHAHPTLSEAVMESAAACFDKPIHS